MSRLLAVLGGRPVPGRHGVCPWPTGTRFVPGDVLVEGVSLLARAGAEGTPTVCIGAAGGEGEAGRVPPLRTVVVARVQHAIPALGGRRRQVWLECDLDACAPVAGEVRLLGRAPRGHARRWSLCPVRPGVDDAVHLPDDLRRGDLLAVPCLGLVTPGELGG